MPIDADGVGRDLKEIRSSRLPSPLLQVPVSLKLLLLRVTGAILL